MDFGHRNNFTFHLARAGAELKLGHVAETRSFAPARLAHQVANIQRSAARPAGERGLFVHALAPLALDSFERLGSRSRIAHREYLRAAGSACGCHGTK